jgi:hypothetical protein
MLTPVSSVGVQSVFASLICGRKGFALGPKAFGADADEEEMQRKLAAAGIWTVKEMRSWM